MEHLTAVASELKRSNGKTGAASTDNAKFLIAVSTKTTIRGSVLDIAVNDVTGTGSHCSTSNSAARRPTPRRPAGV